MGGYAQGKQRGARRTAVGKKIIWRNKWYLLNNFEVI